MGYTFAPMNPDKDEITAVFTSLDDAIYYANAHNFKCIAVLKGALCPDPLVVVRFLSRGEDLT